MKHYGYSGFNKVGLTKWLSRTECASEAQYNDEKVLQEHFQIEA